MRLGRLVDKPVFFLNVPQERPIGGGAGPPKLRENGVNPPQLLVNGAHAVSKELVMDVKDSIDSFAVLQVPEDTVEHEEVTKECKTSRGLGDASELKEPSSV
ncbi:hypothetical protein Nepgr_019625 [Nepenthes gracilis]|uniref:Uncharacterized protein n=1 Tax=Nepenthes gracilis TaxID=150966 RepID=A0AAD3SVJ9_NEPGR|nr:hypothetical protein Nepgr_019625 [Nepenthes gracilis]